MQVKDADVRSQRGNFVLAYRKEGLQPWVTWCVDPKGRLHTGHYFRWRWNATVDLGTR